MEKSKAESGVTAVIGEDSKRTVEYKPEHDEGAAPKTIWYKNV